MNSIAGNNFLIVYMKQRIEETFELQFLDFKVSRMDQVKKMEHLLAEESEVTFWPHGCASSLSPPLSCRSHGKHIDRVYINGKVGSCRGGAGAAFTAILESLKREANLLLDLHLLPASFAPLVDTRHNLHKHPPPLSLHSAFAYCGKMLH